MMLFTQNKIRKSLQRLKECTLHTLLIAGFVLLASINASSQTLTLANSTGEAASITAGQTDVPILAINITRSSSGPDVSNVEFTFSTSPTGTFTNLHLWYSDNNTFSGADTDLGSMSVVSGNTYNISGGFTPIAIGGSGGEFFFVVADIDPNISSSTSIGTTVSSGQITATHSVSGSAAGPTYNSGNITQWATDIGSLNAGANNVAVSPLVPDATDQAVFGFSLASNGTQTVTQLTVQLTSNPSTRLSNFRLASSADTDFDDLATDAPIGGLSFDASSGTQVVITGLTEDVSTAKNYFLIADVASTPTGTIQASLGISDVTVNQGQKSGSATGTNYSFLTLDIASLNGVPNNVALSPLVAGSIDRAIFGFSLTSNNTQTVDQLNIQLTNDPAGILSNFRLVSSADTDFDGIVTDAPIGGLSYDASSGTELLITGLAEIVSTTKNYFLVADVDASVNSSTLQVQASLGVSNVSVVTGVVSGSATGTDYAFDAITATIAANNGALTTVIGGNTNKPIFGFSAITNATQSINNVVFTITTTETLANILTTFVLKDDGANTTYSGGGTTLGAVSVTGSGPYTLTFDLSGSPVALSGAEKYFYLIANSPSSAPTTVGVQADLTTIGVTAGAPSSLAGISRTFDVNALVATVATNNGALINMAGSNTDKPIFGFRAQTNGDQSINNVVFTITTTETLANILTTFVLKDDGTNATYSGGGTTLGAVSVTGTGPYTLTFDLTGSPVALSGTDKYFYLLANSPGAAPQTNGVQADLTTIGVTAGNPSSLVGFSRTFDVDALTATVATNNGGLTNVVGGNTNKALFGFRALTNGTQSINNVEFTITTTETLANILTTFVLKDDGTNTSYSGAGTTLGTVLVTGTGPYTLTFDLTGSPVALSGTDKYFYLVANSPVSAPATVGVQADLTTVGVTAGAASTLTGFSRTFDIEALTTTITQLTSGVSPGGATLANRLEAGSGTPLNSVTSANAILGFTLLSNGSQTVDAIRVSFDADPTGKFSALGIRNSTNTTFEMATDALLASTQGATMGVGPYTITLTLSSPLDISTAKNLFIVASIDDDQALQSTAPIIPSIDDVDFTLTPVNITPITPITGNTYYFTQSHASNVILKTAGAANIVIDATNTAATAGDPVTTSNSAILATFTLQDGGASDDLDNLATTLNDLTISVENFDHLDQLALFDEAGVKIPGTDRPTASSVSWTGLGYATTSDRSAGVAGTRDFTVRASFDRNLPDNEETDIAITAAATTGGSIFATANAGGAGTTARNKTEVFATKIVFVSSTPSTNPVPAYSGPVFTIPGDPATDPFTATVAAVDAFLNVDLDANADGLTSVLNLNPSETLSGGSVAAFDVSGYHTFTLDVNAVGSYELEATSAQGQITSEATDANGTSLTVTVQSPGVLISTQDVVLQTMCKSDASGVYAPLGAIVITENNNADFGVGAGLTFLLTLPSGWEFDTSEAGDVTRTPSQNISAIDASCTFLGNSIAKFTYSVSGTNKPDAITIDNLMIRNNGGIDGKITRGGTGVINGCCDDVKNLGLLNTSTVTTVDFSVEALPNDPAVLPNKTQYLRSSKSVILNGIVDPNPPDGTIGSFSGAGITYVTLPDLLTSNKNRYVFNPKVLDVDDYDITFSYPDGSGCISEETKTFDVFDGAINGLQEEYCENQTTPVHLSVNPEVSPGDFTGGITAITNMAGDTAFSVRIPTEKYIQEIVNNNPTTQTFSVTLPKHGLVAGNQYWFYIYNYNVPFSGTDAPYGYIYKYCTVSNVTTNTFDIDVDALGTWDKFNGFGYVYLPVNFYAEVSPYYAGNSMSLNAAGTVITYNMPDHGFSDGASPYLYFYYFDATGYPYSQESFFPINVISKDQFEITLTNPIPGMFLVDPTGAYYQLGYYYSYINVGWYRVFGDLVPDITTLNKKLQDVVSYDVGYFYRPYVGCTAPYCEIYYTANYTSVLLLTAPTVSFTATNLIADLNDTYCEADAAITLYGNFSTVTDPNRGTFSGPSGVINDLGNGTAGFNIPVVPNGSLALNEKFAIEYSYTDAQGCTTVATDSTIVLGKLLAPIANDTTYCQNTESPEDIRLVALANGVTTPEFKWYGNPANVGIDGAQLGTGITDVVNVNKNIFYTGNKTNSAGTSSFYVTQEIPNVSCESPPTTVNLTVYIQPNAAFSQPTFCEDREFTLNGPVNSATGPTAPPLGPYVSYIWNYGDGTPSDTIPTSTALPHTYANSGSYYITLRVEDANGCVNDNVDITTNLATSISVNDNPEPSFTNGQICEQDPTEFVGSTTGGDGVDYAWNFYRIDYAAGVPIDTFLLDGFTQTPAASAPPLPFTRTAKDPIYTFADGAGNYLATIRAYSNLGCYRDSTKLVTILQKLIHTTGNPYSMQAVDNGMGFWALEDIAGNSTWEFVLPTKNTMNNFTSPAWVTSGTTNYNANEKSVINSPCMDISGITRPLLSMDFIMSSDRDGLVLEWSKDGGVIWFPLGNENSGLNWFNSSQLSTQTVGSSTVGWSGASWNLADNPQKDTLVTVRRALDNIGSLSVTDRQKIRFRIAFETDQFNQDKGFGFNNLKIETRNRLSLVENFTNESDGEFDNNDNGYQSFDPAEVAKIQYHLGYPGNDETYPVNTADPSARAAYYGIPLTDQYMPRGYIDGLSSGNFTTLGWANNRIAKQGLNVSPYLLAITTLPASNPAYLKVSVTATVTDPNGIPARDEPILHIAVVEKAVITSNKTSSYVVRKLLPSAIGTALTTPMTPSAVVTIIDSIMFDDPAIDVSNLAIVAFIQDERTKDVYQAALDLNPLNLPSGIVTGIEDPDYADRINLFPNPANDVLNIQLPAAVSKATRIQMIDSYGRAVHENSFGIGEQTKTINTQSLAGGVYIVQIGTPEGGVARRKVMVVHQ